MRCCATSGAGQGGRKSCALMTGEVAEPFKQLALLHGLHGQVFPRLILPCFSDGAVEAHRTPLPTEKNDGFSWLCRLVCAPVGKMPTVQCVSPAS